MEFSSFFTKFRSVRDEGRTYKESLQNRYQHLHVGCARRFEDLEGEDIEILLIAAAMQKDVGELHLHYRDSISQDPECQFAFLCDELEREGFLYFPISLNLKLKVISIPLFSMAEPNLEYLELCEREGRL